MTWALGLGWIYNYSHITLNLAGGDASLAPLAKFVAMQT